jgi:hypothetical protein
MTGFGATLRPVALQTGNRPLRAVAGSCRFAPALRPDPSGVGITRAD